MGSITSKGYPFPVGTDRVMDGDNAIRALAEAVEADALITHALPVGQSLAATTVIPISWQAPTEDGCALTKTSASVFTVTQAGLYVVTCVTNVSGIQSARAFIDLTVGTQTARATFTSDSRSDATLVTRCIVGAQIKVEIYVSTAVNMSAAAAGGFLNVTRLGRSIGAAAPV